MSHDVKASVLTVQRPAKEIPAWLSSEVYMGGAGVFVLFFSCAMDGNSSSFQRLVIFIRLFSLSLSLLAGLYYKFRLARDGP